jgi:uncharacterized protein
MSQLIDSQWFTACESHWGVVREFDIFAVAQQNQRMQGAFSLNILERAIDGLPEQPWVRDLAHKPQSGLGIVWFELVGYADKQNRLWLNLHIVAKASLVCQRCLMPFIFELDEEVPFHLVRRPSQVESDADDIDPDAPERLLGSSRFDLMVLIEDQVILGLPYVPKHDVCQEVKFDQGDEATLNIDAMAPKKVSPFLVLEGLKNKLKKEP